MDQWGRPELSDWTGIAGKITAIGAANKANKAEAEFTEAAGATNATLLGKEAKRSDEAGERTEKQAKSAALVEEAERKTLMALQNKQQPDPVQSLEDAQGQANSMRTFREQTENQVAIKNNQLAESAIGFKVFQDDMSTYQAYKQMNTPEGKTGQAMMAAKMLNDPNTPHSAEVNPDGTLHVKFLGDDGKKVTLNKSATLEEVEAILGKVDKEFYNSVSIGTGMISTAFNYDKIADPDVWKGKGGKEYKVSLQKNPKNANEMNILVFDEDNKIIDKYSNRKDVDVVLKEITGAGFTKQTNEMKSAEASYAKELRSASRDVAKEDRSAWEKNAAAEYKRIMGGKDEFGNLVPGAEDGITEEEAREKSYLYADKLRAAEKTKESRPGGVQLGTIAKNPATGEILEMTEEGWKPKANSKTVKAH